jgi:hypothetical protein
MCSIGYTSDLGLQNYGISANNSILFRLLSPGLPAPPILSNQPCLGLKRYLIALEVFYAQICALYPY